MFHKGEIEDLRRNLAVAQARVADLEAAGRDHARRDERTGLLLLDAFHEIAGKALQAARRMGEPAALLLLDIDGFRHLNTESGASVASLALRHVAGIIRTSGRSNDLIARSSADEIAIYLPLATLEGAMAAAERFVTAVESSPPTPAGPLTISAGVAVHTTGATTIEALMATAAESLADARAAGGARASAAGCAAAPVLGNPRQRDAIDALAVALLERDRYTGEHSESVVELARTVARALGLKASEIERIAAAALLHDIGKVAMPDSILNKPSALDEAEWAVMREHPLVGERILRAIPGMAAVATIVRHEHERFDGTGYPDGLKGQDIPIGSRIILACDTFHAMTSDRPYRAAMTESQAIREISTCAGTQFDPEVTEVLIGHLYGRPDASAPAVTDGRGARA
jgi:diguanylate cyclase (GGDEF)-like protein/putative nucleotidyltransferase with HDIG domain